MKKPIKVKIGRDFEAALSLTQEEWDQHDWDALELQAAIRQGDFTYPAVITQHPDELLIAMVVDTSNALLGSASFDLWIGKVPIPGHLNIPLEFFRGAAQ